MDKIIAVWFNSEEYEKAKGWQEKWEKENRPLELKISNAMKKIFLAWLEKQENG